MFSLENKNKIGIFGSFLLITTTFLQNAITFLGHQIVGDFFYGSTWFYIYYVVVYFTALAGIIVLISFIKEFFKHPNINTLILGVTFFVHSFIWAIYSIIYNNFFTGMDDYIVSKIINVFVVLLTIILFVLISMKLLNNGGFARLISIGGFAYIILYIANSIWNFISIWSGSVIISIIALFYSLVPSALLVSYFLFVENE